jgi:hypothetical protein
MYLSSISRIYAFCYHRHEDDGTSGREGIEGIDDIEKHYE